MKAIRLWQGKSDRISGRGQVAESCDGSLFIRVTESCSSGLAIRCSPRFGKWKKLYLKKSSFHDGHRKIKTNISRIGSISLSQIGGAKRLRLPEQR